MAFETAWFMPGSQQDSYQGQLSGLVERLFWGREYLGAYINNQVPLKACHHLQQKQPKETNDDIRLC